MVRECFEGGFERLFLNRFYFFKKASKEVVLGAETIDDYRPIALSNAVYFIVAKVLANRLRSVLPCWISPVQSMFISGRKVTKW
jgi:hypothetical protein